VGLLRRARSVGMKSRSFDLFAALYTANFTQEDNFFLRRELQRQAARRRFLYVISNLAFGLAGGGVLASILIKERLP
jgi:hypothetical protein